MNNNNINQPTQPIHLRRIQRASVIDFTTGEVLPSATITQTRMDAIRQLIEYRRTNTGANEGRSL